jgi:hypothetical protein
MFKNITFRSFLVFLCILALLLSSEQAVVRVAANSNVSDNDVSSENEMIKSADILLIYDSSTSAQELQSIEVIIKSITYLQRSVAFLPADQCIDILDNYENVICYNIDINNSEVMSMLARTDKNVFILGGDAISEYIRERECNIKTTQIDNVAISLNYTFSNKKSFSNLNYLKDTAILEGEFTYQSGLIEYGNTSVALYSGLEDFIYTPCIDLTDEIMCASFAYEAAMWLWPYTGKPHTYSQYIVINEVYPFYPPEYLLEIIDDCIKRRLSFTISVMPIFENGDYPAMKRFCEVLRYAQANGGAVILHLPNIVAQGDNIEQLWEYLTYTTEAYTNFGVYPLGIQVPESYQFDEAGQEVLKRYSSVFYYKDGTDFGFDIKERFNTIYKDGHILVAPAYKINQEQYVQFETMSTAAYITVTDDIHDIKEQITSCIQSDVVHKSLWNIDNTVYADNLYYYTKNGELFFNNERVSLEYTPFSYEKYKYDSGIFKWIAKDLSGLNKQLTWIVIISSIIFILFIIIGRIRNRKRFLLPREEKDKNGLD